MGSLGEGFKDVFLAGIGAMAVTGEKAKDMVDQLIERGELTVDQGKQINTELKHKVEDAAEDVQQKMIEARLAVMTAAERTAFAAKVAETAEALNARDAAKAAEEAAAAAGSPVPEVDASALAAKGEAAAE